MIRRTLFTLRHQRDTSRNLREGAGMKLRRAFWCCAYLLKAVAIGVRGMSREQLGEIVEYDGRRCFVNNWAGSESPSLCADGWHMKRCDRKQMRRIRSVGNYANRFAVMFEWYAMNWLWIDVNARLYP